MSFLGNEFFQIPGPGDICAGVAEWGDCICKFNHRESALYIFIPSLPETVQFGTILQNVDSY